MQLEGLMEKRIQKVWNGMMKIKIYGERAKFD